MAPKKVLLSIDERAVAMHGDTQIAACSPNIHVDEILKLSILNKTIFQQVLNQRVLQNVYTERWKDCLAHVVIPIFDTQIGPRIGNIFVNVQHLHETFAIITSSIPVQLFRGCSRLDMKNPAVAAAGR
jgi:hypothetical protein